MLIAQPQSIDKIVAIVGDKAILLSEVESQVLQMEQQATVKDSNLRCNVLEDIIIQKLLLNRDLGRPIQRHRPAALYLIVTARSWAPLLLVPVT